MNVTQYSKERDTCHVLLNVTSHFLIISGRVETRPWYSLEFVIPALGWPKTEGEVKVVFFFFRCQKSENIGQHESNQPKMTEIGPGEGPAREPQSFRPAAERLGCRPHFPLCSLTFRSDHGEKVANGECGA